MLYRSLIYRELKLTRRHNILVAVLLLLMVMMFIIADVSSYAPEEAEEGLAGTVLLCALLGVIGALAAGMNNGVHKADINTGWRRYSFVLPVTGSQKALADLLVKLIYTLLLGLVTAVYPIIVKALTGFSVMRNSLSIYLLAASAAMVFDTLYTGIIMLAQDPKELKKYGAAAGVAGLILLNLIPDGGDRGIMSFGKALAELTGTWSCLGMGVLALGVTSAVYYYVLRRAYERREP